MTVVPRVLRRERLGHGPSSDRYTHIDDEMTTEMLASLTRRLQRAVETRARSIKHEAPNRVWRSRFLGAWLARSGPGKRVLSPIALPVGPSGTARVLTQRSDLGGRNRFRPCDPSLVRQYL